MLTTMRETGKARDSEADYTYLDRQDLQYAVNVANQALQSLNCSSLFGFGFGNPTDVLQQH